MDWRSAQVEVGPPSAAGQRAFPRTQLPNGLSTDGPPDKGPPWGGGGPYDQAAVGPVRRMLTSAGTHVTTSSPSDPPFGVPLKSLSSLPTHLPRSPRWAFFRAPAGHAELLKDGRAKAAGSCRGGHQGLGCSQGLSPMGATEGLQKQGPRVRSETSSGPPAGWEGPRKGDVAGRKGCRGSGLKSFQRQQSYGIETPLGPLG